MTILVVDLNDTGILAHDERRGQIGPGPEPGLALVEKGNLSTGTAAAARARLLPRQVDDRLWIDLDTAPLPSPFPADLTRADLAHAQLAKIWNEAGPGISNVVLAVPGTFSERQLGLALGIGRGAGMPVQGLVDSAVAGIVGIEAEGRLLHLDLQLHRMVLTEIRKNGGLSRGRVWIIEQAGFVGLQKAWARHVAQVSVRRLRFDPLHAAATEQDLYLRLPDLLRDLATRDRSVVELGSERKSRLLEIDRAGLVRAVKSAYDGISQAISERLAGPEPRVLVLSHRLSTLPGLAERLAGASDHEPLWLGPAAVPSGVLARLDEILRQGEEIPYVTHLAGNASTPLPPQPPQPRPSRLTPTHLLHGDLAYAITAVPLHLGSAVSAGTRRVLLDPKAARLAPTHCRLSRGSDGVVVEDLSTEGTFLNGHRIEGSAPAAAGDRLQLGDGGLELKLIALVADDGS